MAYSKELLVTYHQYMTRRKWKLIGEKSEIDEWGDEFEDRGRSLLDVHVVRPPSILLGQNL
jgi:hypothetical protein